MFIKQFESFSHMKRTLGSWALRVLMTLELACLQSRIPRAARAFWHADLGAQYDFTSAAIASTVLPLMLHAAAMAATMASEHWDGGMVTGGLVASGLEEGLLLFCGCCGHP